ncbi:DUF805 domain-containing protein [Streptomyces collinus]|uniref:DUF805 domain-containing protein n=1 Tax=Streptomyces collinus TaxID=42684 RepID=UPI0029422D62|nr:DUF805 domain-containing protein [Streptomyces collinus]
MNWYLDVLKKYAVFSGRARRQEFWMFALFNFIINIVLTVVDNAIGSSIPGLIYALAVLIPGLAVTVRRLHDTGRSGWAILISLIPLVGTIILIVWLAGEGKAEPNEHGANPKYATAA